MNNAIILHGRPTREIYYSTDFPSSSNFAWIPWLQKQLLARDIMAHTPEVPHAYEPNYKTWKDEFERYDVNNRTILIGHSAAAGFLVRWLSERKDIHVSKLILVAPGFSLLDGNSDLIDSSITKRVGETVIFTSDNDPSRARENGETLCQKLLGVKLVMLKGFGHFVPEHMGRVEFPEILEEVL